MSKEYSQEFINDIIRMAWEDDVSFDKIKKVWGTSEADVIKIMRANLKAGSFKLWRKRVTGRSSKHEKRTKLLRFAAEDLLESKDGTVFFKSHKAESR
jgi:uncharacterized protein (TIGR03643 family)